MESNSIINLIVQDNDAGTRIDKYLSQILPQYSRNFFQQLIDTNSVTINNILAKSSTLVKSGDQIAISIPRQPERPIFVPVNNDLGIKILYTHQHFFIIYKPAGLLVHQTEAHSTAPTVVDWLLTNYEELKDIGTIERPGIIHRLDKDTSGVMVIARTNYAHLTFSQLFQKRLIHKTYYAIVQGHPATSGTINLSIGRDPTNRKKMATFLPDDKALSLTSAFRVRQSNTKRIAITHYTILKYFKDHTLVEIKPVTGRTHQIRVHFAAINHPLVGDTLYGIPSKLITRQALHAYRLAFEFEKEQFDFVAEIPDDLQSLIQILEN